MYVLYNIHEIVLLIKIMRKLYQILYNVGRLTDAPGGGLFPFQGGHFSVGFSFPGGHFGVGFSFPGGHFGVGRFARGKGARNYEARFSPSRSPFPGTHFEAYVVECATLLAGRCTPGCRSRQAEPMDEGGRESGSRSGPVPCFFAQIDKNKPRVIA